MTGEIIIRHPTPIANGDFLGTLIKMQEKGEIVTPRRKIQQNKMFFGSAGAAYKHRDGSFTWVRIK